MFVRMAQNALDGMLAREFGQRVIVLAVVTELAGVLGPMVGASRRYDGPLGKSDRAFVFGALGLWAGLGGALPEPVAWLMPALALLLVVTIINRVRRGLAEIPRAAR